MRKHLSLIIILILLIGTALATVKHSPSLILDYKKYYKLSNAYPQNNNYRFDFAATLLKMGKIEAAGKELSKINDNDNQYAKKITTVLEKQNQKQPKIENNFKLGFCYYFLYEELNGRIELANRRIVRGKRDNDPERIRRETAVKKELQPSANHYKDLSIANFEKVAKKRPKDTLNAWGYAYMAVVYGIEKNWEQAKKLCEKAIAIEPNAYAIRAAYMETLRQTGHTFAATGQLTKALRLKSAQEKYEKEVFGNEYQL